MSTEPVTDGVQVLLNAPLEGEADTNVRRMGRAVNDFRVWETFGFSVTAN